jgi:hypothetical protein
LNIFSEEGTELSDQEITGQENEGPATTAPEAVSEAPSAEEPAVSEPEETLKAPEPTAIGDEKITILKHDIYRKGGEGDTAEAIGIELAIKNVSDTVIGSVLFEAVLYDIEGNILDTVEHKTTELKPNVSRNLRINYSGPKSDKVKSYCVRVAKTILTPEPVATGNERIAILKHSLIEASADDRQQTGVELAIRNVSDSTIAAAIFEAIFYDIEGNIVDTVKHREIDLRPETSRGVLINTSIPESYKVKSYSVKITRMTTTDVEKVQLRRHEIRTNEAGEEEVRGVVKNISDVKTDAALVANFYDPKKENIGTRVIILRGIEPDTIRQFHFIFKPQAGDIVRTYTLNIGEIVE